MGQEWSRGLQEGWEWSRVPSGETRGVERAGSVWEDLPDGREKPKGPSERGRSWEALQEGWNGSTGPTSGPGGVRRPCHRARKCREAILEVQESSGGPAGGPGGHSPGGTGGVGRPSRMDGKVWKILWEGPEGSGEMGGVGMPIRRPEVVWKPSQKTRRSWKSILESQEGLGVPSGKPGGVRKAGRGQVVLSEGPVGFGRSSRRIGRKREAHPGGLWFGRIRRPSWRAVKGREAVPGDGKGR